jgi:hypothetical protein
VLFPIVFAELQRKLLANRTNFVLIFLPWLEIVSVLNPKLARTMEKVIVFAVQELLKHVQLPAFAKITQLIQVIAFYNVLLIF